MLSVTSAAAAAIRELVADLPGGAGLRVQLEKPGNGTEPEFGLHVAETPEAGDDLIETDGARVFLDPAAGAYFEGKVLDAEGDTFTFAPVVREPD
jgi:iron-sulfur cluster assembly protein